MVPESIQSTITKLQSEGLNVIVAGGLAVNAHGFSRVTTDADLIIKKDDRDATLRILLDLGFTENGSTHVSTRLSHHSHLIPFLDLLWTEDATFQVFLQEAITTESNLKTLALPHLIAMKIHAISQSPDRLAKDSEDIRWLLKQNLDKIGSEEYQLLLGRFASEETKNYLQSLYPPAT